MRISSALSKMKDYKLVSYFLKPDSLQQFKRYIITGVSSVALEMLLLFLLTHYAGLNVIVSNSIALTLVFWFNFSLNRNWSFQSKGALKSQLAMYAVLFLINLGASDLIMHLLTHQLQIPYLVSKLFSIGVIVSWNFVIYRKVIYRQ